MSPIRALHPRHRLDASLGDAMFALAACVFPRVREIDDVICCLSVRSAFELLLETLDFPYGDEIIVPGLTHPDMLRIIELNGLNPVAIDIDADTLSPSEPDLEKAVTPRTRAVLVTHLFGNTVDIDPVVAVATKHNLLIVEDCAQSLQDAEQFGDERAHVSLFSFGLIKTATAFGGALACVRHPELAMQMTVRHSQWPRQSRTDYARRVLHGIAAIVLSDRWVYGALSSRFEFASLVRSPSLTNEHAFRTWIRRQPCTAISATIKHRLRYFPSNRIKKRTMSGDDIASSLAEELAHPGSNAKLSTHWLFPVTTRDPEDLIALLDEAGFEATQATTQISAADDALPNANRLIQEMVFLPAYPELPARERKRLKRLLTKFAARQVASPLR